MAEHPSGTVTFLFTDIEGSTKLAQEHPDRWESLRARHHAILQSVMDAHNGYVFKTIGDAFCVAFHTAGDGLNAALDAQRDLKTSEFLKNSEVSLRVRMGLHTGSAELQGQDYRGYLTMAKVQRVMSVAYGGQVLLSNTTAELLHGELQNGISLRDMKEHRLKGLSDPERLWQLVAPDLQNDFPPLQSLKEIPNNLPVQLTSFIGREKEVGQIKQRLEKNRLVTLTGSGGIGKTRLSIQVASELLGEYPNGTWLVELAPITDPALVTQTVCAALDVTPQGNANPLSVLTDYLKPKKILLVVDNCEHLIDASAQLCEALLHACPNVRIIASSREALGIDGENAYRVSSLSLPNPNDGLVMIEKSEAVTLFIERATATLPEFEMTKANAAVVAQICQRLDGIALAIELAASRVKLLKVEQIASRLDDAFRLLTGGSRTALPRQQTLRALIDWSYNLLSDEEQTALRRLSVFVGGWTLEAAESVCDNQNMLDLLTYLVDKSLVAVDHDHVDEPRYYMLETIRQYAREKLAESEEAEAVRLKHSEWFIRSAERAKKEYLSRQNVTSLLNQFKNDYENFRAALDWLLANKQFENYARLAFALGMFWFDLNYYQEGRYWLEIGLDHRDQLSKRVTARILRVLCRILARMGDYELAIRYGEESVALAREFNDKAELALTIEFLATSVSESGDEKREPIIYSEALSLYQELGDASGVSDMMLEIGWAHVGSGNTTEGFVILEESLKIKQQLGAVDDIAYSLFVIGTCRWHNQEYDKSEIALKEGLKLFFKLGNKWFAMGCLGALAGVCSGRHQPNLAAKYLGVTDRVIESIRGRVPPFWEQQVRNPTVVSIRAQLNDSDFDKAYNEGYSLTPEQALAFALDVANE